jgi:cell division protein DivIC
MKRFNKIKQFFFIFLLGYLLVVVTKGCLHNKTVLNRYEFVQEQYEREQQLNKEIKQKLEEANTPEFIELMARKKLGLVKPGEIVYKIVEEKL